MLRDLCIILVLTATGILYSLIAGLSPLPWAEPVLEAGEIHLAEAQALKVIWVDVRAIEEFEKSHLPDALLFNEDDWDQGLFELMNVWLVQPRPIVVYCGSESCNTSQRIAERLRESLPDAEIYRLKGGWDAWQE